MKNPYVNLAVQSLVGGIYGVAMGRMFFGDHPPLFYAEIAFRTVVIYAYTLALIRWIGASAVRVIFEPTGPYHRIFEASLVAAGIEGVERNIRSSHLWKVEAGLVRCG